MKFIWLCLWIAVFSSSVIAEELKIGVVNAAAVMEQSPQKASALARLQKEFSSRSKSIEAKGKKLQAKEEKLRKDSSIYSAAELKNKERDIISEQRDLRRIQDEYSEDLSIRRNEELRKLENEIAQTIVELSKKESYDLVLYQGVIFARNGLDMTEKVITLLKAKK